MIEHFNKYFAENKKYDINPHLPIWLNWSVHQVALHSLDIWFKESNYFLSGTRTLYLLTHCYPRFCVSNQDDDDGICSKLCCFFSIQELTVTWCVLHNYLKVSVPISTLTMDNLKKSKIMNLLHTHSHRNGYEKVG